MPTVFPTALDDDAVLPNPTGADLLENANNLLDHDYQHSTENDALQALEVKVGIDSSAVVTSLDYLLKNVASSNPGHVHTIGAITGLQAALDAKLPLGGGTMSGVITFAAGQTFDAAKLAITSQATGDILYASSASAWTRLGVGTNGWVLTLAAGVPTWAAAGGGGVAIGDAIGTGTSGSLLYVDSGGLLAQDNANLFYDATNKAIGLGTSTLFGKLTVLSTVDTPCFHGSGPLANGLYTAALLFNNHFPTAGQTGHKTGINFSMVRADGGTPTTAVAGRILAGKDGTDWIGVDAAAANAIRHGFFAIETCRAGNTTEKWRINSLGYMGVGNIDPIYRGDFQSDSLGATAGSTDGLRLRNSTAATAILAQFSPFLEFAGQGWKTNATAGSEEVRFRFVNTPVLGAAHPTGLLTLQTSINASAWSTTTNFMFGSNGSLYMGASTATAPSISGGSNLDLWGGSGYVSLNSANGIYHMSLVGDVYGTWLSTGIRIGGDNVTPVGRVSLRATAGGTGEGIRWSGATDTLRNNLYPSASGLVSLITDQGLRVATGLIVGTGDTALPTTATVGIVLGSSSSPTANPAAGSTFIWSTGSGFFYRTAATDEGAAMSAHVHNRKGSQAGVGTDYSLTATLAAVTFGTTNPLISLPTLGTYLVTATVSVNASGGTAGDQYEAELYNSSDAAAIGVTQIVTDPGTSRFVITLIDYVAITAAKNLTIRARNATAARGVITSTLTQVSYIRLF